MLTPTGRISLPLEKLRTLLAASATWQAWCEAADAAAAAGSVHLVAPPDAEGESFSRAELEAERPLAVVYHGPGWALSRSGVAAYRSAGLLMLRFEADVPEEHQGSERDAEIWFLNQLGAVTEEMVRTDEGLGHLVVESIRFEEPPQRVPPESRGSEGDAFVVTLMVEYLGA